MRIKGAILTLAIALSLACLYQLSFTFVTYRVEQKAKEYAKGDFKKEVYYLDSVSGKVVYNFLWLKKYTYKDTKERMINLGLDLKGGMNVILEVSVVDIIKSLSNFSNDTTFNKAIARASEMQKNSQDDYITLFGRAFEQINPNGKLAVIFNTFELREKVTLASTNDQVLDVLRQETDDAIDNSFNILSSRIDKFGVVQPVIRQLDTKGRIEVQLPGIKDQERVRKLLQGTANLEFYETYDNADLIDELNLANTRIKEYLAATKGNTVDTTKVKQAATPAVPDTTKSNLGLLSKIKGDTTKKSDSTLNAGSEAPLFAVLQPSINPQTFQAIPGSRIGFAEVKDTAQVNAYLNLKQVRQLFPNNIRFFWSNKPSEMKFQGKDGNEVVMFDLHAIKTNKDGRPVLTGDVITSASPEYGQNKSSAEVSMGMNAEGAKQWARITKDNVDKCIAIVMDQMVFSSPVVNQEITGGNSSISGMEDYNEASDLAIVLKSGKMPAPARIVQEEVVGPSLGQESVNSSMISFIIAFIVVLGYMVFYYSRAGWIADIALMVNVFFIIGVLASLGAVLTLPGMAGIVLTLGMAVDANVIIYERIREELRHGKGIKLAISDGYKYAYSAIIDGNVTTLLTGVILFIFGSGPIQGFATTLIIGILTSLFTAIFISRLIFERLLSKNKEVPFSIPMTANLLHDVKFDFIGKRKIFYVASSIVIVLGLASLFTQGLNLGVDFKGGRTYVVRFEKDVNTVDVQNMLAPAFEGEAPEVKTYGSENQVKITTKYLVDATGNANDVDSLVEAKLYQGLKPVIGENVSFKDFTDNYRQSSMKVGSTVSDDIKTGAMFAIIFSLIGIFLYIFIRFRDWRFGLGGVVSLTHDVLVVLGIYSLLQNVMPFSLEVDQAFIAAVLTVIGYSINDSVIIFDRIREWTTLYPKRDRKDLFNGAMNSTLGRTMNTSLTTLFTLIVIFIFGGEVIRGFIFALLIGIGVGTYSSIMNAAPVVYDALQARDRKAKKLGK